MASSAAMDAFFEESDSHIEIAEAALLELEKNKADADTINELFRAIHSIKGNAGLVGLTEIHAAATEMETILDRIRSGKETVSDEDRDRLFDDIDLIKSMVNSAKNDLGVETESAVTAGETSTPDAAKPADETVARAGSAPTSAPVGKPDKAVKVTAKSKALASEGGGTDDIQKKTVSYLTFFLGKEQYGFIIGDVREIIIKKDITIVPNSKEFVAGVMNLRGVVIPVVDARKRLGFSERGDRPKEENIVVVENDGLSTGVLVDMVDDILKLEPDMIVSADKALGGLRDSSKFIGGLGKAGKSTIMLIETSSFCDSNEEFF